MSPCASGRSVFFLSLALTSCSPTEHPVAPHELPAGTNVPQIRLVADTLEYSVCADLLSSARELPLSWSMPRYALTVEIGNQSRGRVFVQIHDDQWRTLEELTFGGDTLYSDSSGTRRFPHHATVVTESFSGRLTMTLRSCGIVPEVRLHQFPLEPGTEWRYRVRAGQFTEFVVVTIMPDSLLPGEVRVRPWKVQTGTRDYWMFSTVYNDTLSFLPIPPIHTLDSTPPGWDFCPRYVFPLTRGRGWKSRTGGFGVSNYWIDPTTVSYRGWASVHSADSIIAGGHVYRNALRVDHWPLVEAAGDSSFVDLTHWIVPDTGVVSIRQRTLAMGEGTWELIEFHRPPAGAD